METQTFSSEFYSDYKNEGPGNSFSSNQRKLSQDGRTKVTIKPLNREQMDQLTKEF